jgi:hypothetical protein
LNLCSPRPAKGASNPAIKQGGVTASAKTIETIRIEASDPRSDDRRRIIDIARDSIAIRRAVAGVTMTLRIPADAYKGVALRIAGLDDGGFHY